MCVVTAELIAAQSGLGYMIQCRYPNSPADVVRTSSSFGVREIPCILTAYACYYNGTRTHLALNKDTPFGRLVQHIGTITVVERSYQVRIEPNCGSRGRTRVFGCTRRLDLGTPLPNWDQAGWPDRSPGSRGRTPLSRPMSRLDC